MKNVDRDRLPAKRLTTDGAKDEETIIFLSGEGPATTTRVEEEE